MGNNLAMEYGSGAKPMKPEEAIDVADAYAEGTLAVESYYLQMPHLQPISRRMQASVYDPSALSMRELLQAKAIFGAGLVDNFQVAVLTASAVREWSEYRVVYRVHPALFQEIAHTESDTPVPCEVLSRLPHPNPFVVFPQPLPTDASPRSQIRIADQPVFTGMLVTGLTEDRSLCSTHDPAIRYLNVALAARLRYAGQESTYEERTLVLPLTGDMTAEQMAREMIGTISKHDPYKARSAEARDAQAFRLAINLLLYVGSAEPDLDTHQVASRRGRKKSSKARRHASAAVVDVGFHVGPTLWEGDSKQYESSESDGRGGPVRPHIRRGHYHRYWTGPKSGPQRIEIRWLHPMLVRPKERNKDVTTVIPVE